MALNLLNLLWIVCKNCLKKEEIKFILTMWLLILFCEITRINESSFLLVIIKNIKLQEKEHEESAWSSASPLVYMIRFGKSH